VATHITNLCAAAKASRESAQGAAKDTAGPSAPQGVGDKGGGEAPEDDEGTGNAEQLVAVVGGFHLIGGKEMEARAKDTAQVGGRCPSHHLADSFLWCMETRAKDMADLITQALFLLCWSFLASYGLQCCPLLWHTLTSACTMVCSFPFVVLL
jgi:hypothetical protein